VLVAVQGAGGARTGAKVRLHWEPADAVIIPVDQ
jgi:hypothetical protein